MNVRLSVEYEVEDDDPKLEEAGMKIIGEEADALADAVKRRLADAGAKVTSFRADYQQRSGN